MPSFFADRMCRMQDALRLSAATSDEHKRTFDSSRKFGACTKDVVDFSAVANVMQLTRRTFSFL
jgi:hypothetical protein